MSVTTMIAQVGSAAAAVAAAAVLFAMPVPAASGATDLESRPLLVFFEPGEAELTPAAQQVALRIAAQARSRDGGAVSVTGFASPDEANAEKVARTRAASVADALEANGVDETPIRIRAEVRAAPALPMAAVAERRVEVVIHPGDPARTAGLMGR